MAVPPTSTVLILGGYGVFGGRIATALIKDARFDVIVAGRDQRAAKVFCTQHGGRAFALDRGSAHLAADIASQDPHIVIDAAGPFQSYGDDPYSVARAAIACGAHYLDLSDDAAFTSGITCLEADAKLRRVTVLSGVSTVPALSSAVADALTSGLHDVHLIESVILPGNRAPRGLSVVRAIVAQAGLPLALWRGGRAANVPGWSGLTRVDLNIPGKTPLTARWASFIGAPDLSLFPKRYRARSVLFRAGLELKVMHGGLAALTGLVRAGIVGSLSPIAKPLKWAADVLELFGSDRGGMRVRVIGETSAGTLEQRDWTLIAEAGDGPHIPALAARVLCAKILACEVEPGARACLGEFSLQEAEAALSVLDAATHRSDAAFLPVFSRVLGRDFSRLSQGLQDLHSLADVRIWSGRADIIRGKSLLSKLAGAVVGFPPGGNNVPVTVTMQRTERGETWIREFGTRRFCSHLAHGGPEGGPEGGPDGSGHMSERFGVLTFSLALSVTNGRLNFPVSGGSCLGIPLPRVLLPTSDTFEFIDEQGRACFDVSISLPLAGHVVTYRGWLTPADAATAQPSAAAAA